MPFESHILHGGMGRRWVSRGAVNGRELIARTERVLSSKSYEGVRWLIIDYTAVTSLDISPQDIQTIKELDDRLAVVMPEIVTAIIVQSDFGFGMTRMWEMMTERPGWSTRAFRTSPEAEAWLREEVRRKFKMELPADLNTP